MNLKETVDEICSMFGMEMDVPEIPGHRNYWLVRTDGGEWFEEFSNESYIAIGYNKLQEEEDFSLEDKDEAVKKIEELYPDKSAGHIYGSLRRFRYEIKTGDIVMIPSERSETIKFGMVVSSEYFEEITDTQLDMGYCPYKRRRNITWLSTVIRNRLDPQLFKMMQSHHTITNATDYDLYIDKTLNTLYIKNNILHSVFDVKVKRDISYNSLQSFINLPDDVNRILFESEYKLKFDSKIRLQSPGDWLLMAADSWAIRLLVISFFVKQFLVGGQTKLFGIINMNNEPLLDILRRNGITLKSNNEQKVQEKGEEINKLSGDLYMSGPGDNAEQSDFENDDTNQQ